MRGTRYGDFSRFPADWRKGYRSVLMQQGRVQLDSDWNDQVMLGQDALRQAIEDMVGGSGAPAAEPGFEIAPELALELGARTALEIPHARDLLPRRDHPYTLELWLSWDGHHGTILDCSAEDGTRAGFRLRVHRDGRLSCRVACTRDEHVSARSEQALPRDAWMHIGVVFEHRHVALFLDGRQVARAHLHEGCPLEGSRIVVGGAAWGDRDEGEEEHERGIHGLLGGLRMWSEARSPGELVTRRRPPPSEPPQPHELAYWPLTRSHESFVTDVVEGRRAELVGERPRWRLVDLAIAPGRYYVDGVLCEQAEPLSYTSQPGCPQRSLPHRGDLLVYIETWEESIDAVQDPSLAERALGGSDTTVRTRIRSCVRVARWHWREDADDPGAPLEHLLSEHGRRTTGRLTADMPGDSRPGNYLYRVEVHRHGHAAHEGEDEAAIEIDVTRVEISTSELVLAEPWPGDPEGAEVEVEAIDDEGAVVVRRHQVVATSSSEGRQRLRLDAEADELADLQVRRVRHEHRVATFKWSRRNGAETFGIAPVKAGSRQVHVLRGTRGYTALTTGDVVEVLDDSVPLDGKPHHLLRVEGASGRDNRTLQLSGEPPENVGREARLHPFLRRWDNSARELAGERIVAGVPIKLDEGVMVTFTHGHYRRGDYWWIVTRQDTPYVEWPTTHGHPAPLPPDGVERRIAPLARVRARRSGVEVEDLRRIFSGLDRRDREDGTGDAPQRAAAATAVGHSVLSEGWELSEPDPAAEDGPGWEQPAAEPRTPDAEQPAAEPPAPDAEQPAAEPPAQDAEQPAAESPGPDAGWASSPPAILAEPGPAAAGLPVLGPAGPPPPGYAATGVELVTRPRWHRAAATGIPAAELRGMATIPGGIALATADAIFAAGPAGVERIAALPTPRHGFATCAVDGLVLLIGGAPVGGRPDGATLVFDTTKRAWTQQPAPMPKRLADSAVAVAAGLVHVLGGAARRPLDTHHVYDPSANTWTGLPTMPVARSGAVAAALGSHVYVAGGTGRGGQKGPLAAHHRFDQTTGSWGSAAPLPGALPVHAAAAGHDWYVVLADDLARPGVRTFLRYVLETGSWEPLPELPSKGAPLSVVAHPAGFVAAGSGDDGQLVLYELALGADFTIFVPA